MESRGRFILRLEAIGVGTPFATVLVMKQEERKMKVLIATEGSEFSDAAIREFSRIFGPADNVVVKVLAAVEPATVPAEPFAVSAEYIQQLDEAGRKHASDVAERAAAEINSRCPSADDVLTKVVVGSPEQAIVSEAEDWGADLIVTGSHGRGFWKRALLGSVSSAVVHHAPCSVLIVREKKGS